MPHCWRLLLAGLFAVLALFVGAAFALFSVPERLEAPLSLFLLCASILAAWNLYRWIKAPRHQVAPASGAGSAAGSSFSRRVGRRAGLTGVGGGSGKWKSSA